MKMFSCFVVKILDVFMLKKESKLQQPHQLRMIAKRRVGGTFSSRRPKNGVWRQWQDFTTCLNRQPGVSNWWANNDVRNHTFYDVVN